MAQMGRFDNTFLTLLGTPAVGASVAVYREGATVNGNQSGTSPLAVTVRHAGKVATGDSVFVNTTTGTTYSATRTSAMVITLSGFVGTLALTGGDRLTPSNSQPTLYSDDQGGATTSNPMTTDASGRVSAWMEYGAYDLVVSGGGATTKAFLAEVTPSQAPGQVRYADEFATGSSTGGIQEAINDLPTAGGTVILSGGITYAPTVATTLISSLTILGNGATIQRVASLDALSIFKDAGSALSKITIRDIVFDNNSRAVSGNEDILLTGGCSDIRVEGCLWINLTNRTEDLTRIAANATKSNRIAFRNNTVVGPGSQQTYNSFIIYDSDNVSVHGNIIDGWGAIKVEGASATSLFNWNISANVMKGVAQSNIFCRIQGAVTIAGIAVSNNTLTDCGKTGIVVDAINAADTGTITNVSVTGNVIRGFALNLADSAILLGGIITTGTYYMNNVTVSANSIDGKDSTGAQPADQNRAIFISSGIKNFSLTGNAIQNCGRDGISVSGATDGTIINNSIVRCVVQDTSASAPTPSQEGGITVGPQATYATKNIIVANNVCKNNGVSGALKSYGINIGPNYGGTITNIIVCNNRCYDDQGTPTQDYGIILGSNGNTGPNDSLIYNNDLRNNATGGITGPLGTATGIFLRDNTPNDGITRNITAVGDSITPSASRILLTANGNYTLTSAPTVIDGYWNGQEIEIMNIDTVDTITIQDQGSLASSNLRLSAASIALAPRDNIRLRYDTTIADWVQIGQVNVI